MKYRDDGSLMSPPLEALVERIPQKYELVLAATKRAKQIIRQQKIDPQGLTEAERTRKPLSMALHDIAEGRVDSQVLATPDIDFDDFGEIDDLQTEIERMGVLPFTTRPAPEFINESTPSGLAIDFSLDDDDSEDGEDDELDAEADTDDETVDPL